ncbi:hypothetical protein AcV5_007034 [Taiwanofungus camphoratus]|nr:hypothetical protein AcV5_007034 [Antrodia cinnamomea]
MHIGRRPVSECRIRIKFDAEWPGGMRCLYHGWPQRRFWKRWSCLRYEQSQVDPLTISKTGRHDRYDLGIKNPIKLAGAILQHSFNPDRLGRIPPLTLVSGGAQHFAQLQGLKLVSPESLIAPRAQQEWSRWRQMLEPTDTVHRGSDKPGSTNVLYLDPTSASTPNTSTSYGGIQDTVGAIAWNAEGALAAGVSSGGLLLKDSGRIGEVVASRFYIRSMDLSGNTPWLRTFHLSPFQAAVYGAGCWAKQPLAVSARGVACSVSGAGEYIIRSLLAKSIGDAVYESDRGDTHSDIQQVLDNHFSTVRHGNDQRESSAGLLLLLKEQGAFSDVIPRLWCAFTTESMAVAYASSLDPKPKALILRRPEQYRTDTSSVYITALPLTRV